MRIKMLALPCAGLDGRVNETLKNDCIDAMTAIDVALEALHKTEPMAADYANSCAVGKLASKQHAQRMQALHDIKADMLTLALELIRLDNNYTRTQKI